MAVSHVKSDTIADFTGTITGFNSQGSTTTIAATDLVRPVDWNSAHNQFYTLTGNTAGNSTASGTNVLFAGSGNVSVGGSTGTVVISGPAYTHYEPKYHERVVGQQGQGTFFMQPMWAAPMIRCSNFVLPVHFTATSNSSGSFTVSFFVGIYTSNGSTLSLLHSTSHSMNATMSGTVGSYSLFAGFRDLRVPWTTTIGASDYWVGIGSRTTTGGAAGMTLSQQLWSQPNSAWSGEFGSASNATKQYQLGQGFFTVTTAGVPGSMHFSHISGSGSLNLRPPSFYFMGNTV